MSPSASSIPAWVLIAVALIALAGSLGSQIITAKSNLLSKGLELTFTRKAECYKDFALAAGAFRNNPADHDLYRAYVDAERVMQIVASDAVLIAMQEKDGMQELRVVLREKFLAKDSVTREQMNAIYSSWDDEDGRVATLMRVDLHELSKTIFGQGRFVA